MERHYEPPLGSPFETIDLEIMLTIFIQVYLSPQKFEINSDVLIWNHIHRL